MSDVERGLYRKFNVERTDGASAVGEKHAQCDYLVIDLVHDRHAYAAVHAYMTSCQAEYPKLAADLKRRIGGMY